MNKVPPMVSMEIEPKDNDAIVDSARPMYPYGLSICLCQDELNKLDVDYNDWSVGDTFHLHAFAKITSISKQETNEGEQCRVEMQIIALSGEDEEAENYEEEQEDKGFRPLG